MIVDIGTLPNCPAIRMNAGYVVIAERYITNDILAILAVKPNLSEYVTWIANEAGECYHGHYITDFNRAVQDFNKRY